MARVGASSVPGLPLTCSNVSGRNHEFTFRLLGPVQVVMAGTPIPLARPQHRNLLALLLLDANRPVAVDSIAEALWGGRQPATATTQVQNMVSAIRRVLARIGPEAGRVCRVGAGYQFDVDETRLDLATFTTLVKQARTADNPTAVALLRDALRLWHGTPLADVSADYASAARESLVERRLTAVEALYERELALGHHAEIVADLTAEFVAHPVREQLAAHLMTALYRSGRQADALQTYRTVRDRLVDEHALEPGPALRDLQRRILTADPQLGQAPSRRHHVPPAPAHFVGRKAELDHIVQTLGSTASGRRIGVYGPPGVGKTALALVAADRLRDRYQEGQLFVELDSPGPAISGRDLLGILLRALGLPGSAVPDCVEDRAILLRGLVGEQGLLLVLDGVTGEDQVRPALTGQWAAVLLTSRSRLAGLDNTEHLRLPVLDPPAAVDLLARVAQQQTISDRPGAERIAQLCGGLPLAVRIAGAKLAGRPHWTASRMADRLADERHRLDELSIGGQAVRASLDVSYTMLGAATRRAVRVIGWLGQSIVDEWSVAAALGVAEPTATDLIEELVTAEFLEAARGPAPALRVHDLIRVFGWERFVAEETPDEPRAIAIRVAEAYLGVALLAEEQLARQGIHPCGRWPDRGLPRQVRPDDTRVPPDLDLIAWLTARRSGAQAAVRAAHREGLWAHCWALSRALTPLLEAGAHHDDWAALAGLALEAAGNAAQPGWLAAIEAGLGTLYHYQTRLPESRRSLERALAVWHGPADRRCAAYAKLMLAMTLRATGTDGGEYLLRQALRTAADEADPVLEVEALRCLAWLDRDAGRPGTAIKRLQRALRSVDDVPDGGQRLLAYVRHDLGVMQADQGERDAARASLGAALAIFERLDDRHWHALALFRLGEVDHESGSLDRALSYFNRARELFRELHDQLWQASALARLSTIHCELGEYDVADSLLVAAAAMADALGEGPHQAYIEVCIGELREAQGNYQEAADAFEQACRKLAPARRSRWQDRAKAGLDRVRRHRAKRSAAAATASSVAVSATRTCRAPAGP